MMYRHVEPHLRQANHFRRRPFWFAFRGEGFAMLMVVSVICWAFIFAGVAATHYDDQFSSFRTRDRYEEIDRHFRGVAETREERMTAAETLLEFDGAEDPEWVDLSTSTDKTAIESIAATGDVPVIHPVRGNMSQFWRLWLPVMLMLCWLHFSVAAFWAYAYDTHARREFLADLPWKEWWPIWFVLATLHFAPCYAWSARRIRKLQQRRELPTERPLAGVA